MSVLTAVAPSAPKADPASRRQNAAITYIGGNYKTNAPRLMGRHSASEGFLKAFVRHSEVDRLICYTRTRTDFQDFEAAVRAVGSTRPTAWIQFLNHAKLSIPGCLYRPGPDIGHFAWQRRRIDARGYSLCGVTHTTAEHKIMDAIGGLLIAPVQRWDALICTSQAVKAMVLRVLDATSHYLEQRFGGPARLMCELPVIPLGVDCDAFAAGPEAARFRTEFRSRHGIAEEDIVVLFYGRLNPIEKANPLAMYMALEEASRRSGKRFHLLQAGWFASEGFERDFKEGAERFAPSVNHIFIDGRLPENRTALWHAADIFASLSDNIQETFGLTPIEAMAAGLPVVVSDWNGYRDTVRDGIDGFRIATMMPEPGHADDIAFRYETETDGYGGYCGVTSQFISVDTAATADAMVALAENPELRRKMGEAGRVRARDHFDWSVVVRHYQALWHELALRRRSAEETAKRSPGEPANPLRQDPLRLFDSYPTAFIRRDTAVRLRPGADRARLALLRSSGLAKVGAQLFSPEEDIAAAMAHLGKVGACRVDNLLTQVPLARRALLYRTIGWMLKTDLIGTAPELSAASGTGGTDRS
jgi:glycosyltransferase involved in cell wall biosynthesis